jgi:hypothetical protein
VAPPKVCRPETEPLGFLKCFLANNEMASKTKGCAMRALIGSSVAALIAIGGLMAAVVQVSVHNEYAAISDVQRFGIAIPTADQAPAMVMARGE